MDPWKGKAMSALELDGDVTFGSLVKRFRIRLSKTLREFCEENHLDPGNFSKLERGRLAPPQDPAKLDSLARALHLNPKSQEWIEFFHLASIEQGRLPQDIVEDRELMSMLPVLLRTVQGQRLNREQLELLVQKIQSS